MHSLCQISNTQFYVIHHDDLLEIYLKNVCIAFINSHINRIIFNQWSYMLFSGLFGVGVMGGVKNKGRLILKQVNCIAAN